VLGLLLLLSGGDDDVDSHEWSTLFNPLSTGSFLPPTTTNHHTVYIYGYITIVFGSGISANPTTNRRGRGIKSQY
jgi:hypothetical protein